MIMAMVASIGTRGPVPHSGNASDSPDRGLALVLVVLPLGGPYPSIVWASGAWQ